MAGLMLAVGGGGMAQEWQHDEGTTPATLYMAVDLAIGPATVENEDTVGAFVGLGGMQFVAMSTDPAGLHTGQLKLECTAGGAKIRVWADPDKTQAVTLPAT